MTEVAYRAIQHAHVAPLQSPHTLQRHLAESQNAEKPLKRRDGTPIDIDCTVNCPYHALGVQYASSVTDNMRSPAIVCVAGR